MTRLFSECLGLMVRLAGLVIGAVGCGSAYAQEIGRPALGVYDPEATFKDSSGIQFEHVFMPWQDIELESLKEANRYAVERGRQLMVTVEPWTWSEQWTLPYRELARQIIVGERDTEIDAICEAIGEVNRPVIVRWAHEMEDTSGRYAWSFWEPDSYITAYRHFVDACRSKAPMARFMWSPIGEATLTEYYPGDDYVDLVGISVFGLQKYDRDGFGRDRSIKEILKQRYDRVTLYGKPIFAAEVGCDGDEQYERACIQQFTSLGSDFPQLAGAIYFNQVDPYPWLGAKYGKPDWRIPADALVTAVSASQARPSPQARVEGGAAASTPN